MVLVDTSIWIRYLYGREPYVAELKKLLSAGRVIGHDMVYGELLIGDSGGNRQLLAEYIHLPQGATVPHDYVAAFVRHRSLPGRGLGWIDAHLLASAVVGHFQLWTADAAFARATQELTVAYRP